MKKIFSLKLPASIVPQIRTSQKLPNHCLYPVKYTDTKQMQWSKGAIIRQRFVTDDFLMELFETSLQEDHQIKIAFNKSCVVFYYGFNGDIVGKNKKTASSLTLTAGQCGAINVPLGKYQLILARGYSAGFLYIFDNNYLNSVLQIAPSDFRAAGHFRIGSPDYHKFPFFTIDSIGQIMERLRSVNPDQESLSLKMSLLALLKQYGTQLARYKNRPSGEASKKVMSVKNFIETDIRNGPLPAVSDISQQFNIHPDTLNRSFKNTFGIGLKKYVNQAKMKHAYSLLEHDKLSIRLVSERTGYNSTSSFSTQFKLYYGFTPGKAGGDSGV